MAQDITLDFGATSPFVIALDNVPDGDPGVPGPVDLGNPAPISLGIHVNLVGTAGGTDYVEWYVNWSEDNVAFTDNGNMQLIHSTKLNEANAVEDHFEVAVFARYMKLTAVNNSGAPMGASGNSAEYWEIAVNQA
ncbi:MAG: hypothetical protein WBO58_10025 [Gammaproteobacteria bacterium]